MTLRGISGGVVVRGVLVVDSGLSSQGPPSRPARRPQGANPGYLVAAPAAPRELPPSVWLLHTPQHLQDVQPAPPWLILLPSVLNCLHALLHSS
jgi:hypothetical protein